MGTHAGSRRQRHARGVVAAAAALVVAAPLPAGAAQLPVPAASVALPKKIEKLSPYIPQVSCDPTPKPGVLAFARMVLRTYPTTGSLGIVAPCSTGMRSEHKEGRAWDWAVSANRPADVARVNALLDWLLAKDDRGKDAAMARRLGIMYIIWNRRIWGSAYNDEGWRPYTGPNPHTTHVHFSFSWAGAMRRTSWWTGKVAKTDYGPCPRKDGTAPRYDGPNPKRCKHKHGHHQGD